MSGPDTVGRPADYRLEIGELAIDGFEADPAAIGQAIRRELARLLADPRGPFGTLPQQSRSHVIRHVDIDARGLAADASPREIGQAAARAVVSRITAAAPGRRGGAR
ncbi:hypothetical protein [Caulobacter endophyticus]|nr:hypothetical protein [Caulobacter endophyticus]